MTARRHTLESLCSTESWAEYLKPLPPRPKAERTPDLNELQTAILMHLDAWGIRTVSEIGEDLPWTRDRIRGSLLELRKKGLVDNTPQERPIRVDFWHLTQHGHRVTDRLSKAGVKAPPVGSGKVETAETVVTDNPNLTEAIRLYTAEGMGLLAVAREVHIGKERLAHMLRKAGVAIRPKGVHLGKRKCSAAGD